MLDPHGHLDDVLYDALRRAERVHAPEDAEIEALCERIGYGAVMDAAMRLWLRKDRSGGAFIIGGCEGTVRAILGGSGGAAG